MSSHFDIPGLAHDLQTRGFSAVPLPRSLFEDALKLARKFFALDARAQMSVLAATTSGVLGFYPSEDVARRFGNGDAVATLEGARARGYSSFDFVDEPLAATSSVLGRNAWPSAWFASRALNVHRRMAAQGRRLSLELLEHLHEQGWVSKPGPEILNEPCCSLMRLLSYDARSRDPIVSKAHTDYELLSLVLADAPGLQVKTPDGDWVDLQLKTPHACVLAGDMAEALTSGRIQSPLHRVRLENGTRTSAIFFQGLPLETGLSYRRGSIDCPKTFGAHILPLLARGAAHLRVRLDEIEKELGCAVPVSNLFKEGK